MTSRRTLAAAVAAIAMLAGLPGGAAPARLGVRFAHPTVGEPSVYRWRGAVLQSPHTAADVATPATTSCAGGLCEDVPLTVPAGLKTSTLYVRIAWRSPIWKTLLYVTIPDAQKVYPSTGSDGTNYINGPYNQRWVNQT